MWRGAGRGFGGTNYLYFQPFIHFLPLSLPSSSSSSFAVLRIEPRPDILSKSSATELLTLPPFYRFGLFFFLHFFCLSSPLHMAKEMIKVIVME